MGEVLDIDSLTGRLDAIRRNGGKIVFTNGCFDILHPGHVGYLKEAAALGDVLVVGLNSDASVARLKPGRPFNAEQDRAEVLGALGCVSFVVLFSEDSPYELIGRLRPDILVKGGDWAPDRIVGHDLVAETRSLPFRTGYSTTALVNKIRGGSPEPDR